MNNGLAVSCLCFRYCLESKTQNYVRKMIISYNYSILQSTWYIIFLTLSFLNSSTTLVKRACLNSQTYLTNLLYLQKLQWTQKKENITLLVFLIPSEIHNSFFFLPHNRYSEPEILYSCNWGMTSDAQQWWANLFRAVLPLNISKNTE